MRVLREDEFIGGYRLLRTLAPGGMGDVWMAEDGRAERRVVLKFIKREFSVDQAFRTRFLNEAKTLGKLEHDRIVTLYNVFEEDEHLAMVLRYIEGRSLADRIDENPGVPLPIEAAMACARDILPALGFAHAQGIIHRDIKPPNILMDRQARCFLSDFGIAIVNFAERSTSAGAPMGTPHYMSPEQIRWAHKLTPESGGHRTDIYSFGVVLFEMLTGQVPFGHDLGAAETYQIQSMHCSEPPPSLRALNPAVPEALEELVLRTLEKSPDARPQTCAELLEELEAAVGRAATAASPKMRTGTVVMPPPSARATDEPAVVAPAPVSPSIPVTPGITPRPSRRISQAVWLSAGALVIALGVWFVVRSAPKPTSVVTSRDSDTRSVGPTISSGPGTGGFGQGGDKSPPDVKAQKAATLYQTAQDQHRGGNDCAAKATVADAIKTHSQPDYEKFQSSLISGCQSEIQAAKGYGKALDEHNANKNCDAKATIADALRIHSKPEWVRFQEQVSGLCKPEGQGTDNSGTVTEAKAHYQRALQAQTTGDYCGAKKEAATAYSLDRRPEYSSLEKSMKPGCDLVSQ